MVTQGFKDLIGGGVWAASAMADKEAPEDVGIDRAIGWPVAYEQQGSGKEPERTVFNQRDHELDAALLDIAKFGVPSWDAEVDYRPTADAHCFVTTPSGLHVTAVNTGPTFGNATDPDESGQTVWRMY